MENSYTDIEQQFNIKIIPAEIMGSRWSCLVKPTEGLPLSQHIRIRIDERSGFIIYPSSSLTNEQQSEIRAKLMEQL
jgi:hypothetical protein